MPLSPFWRAGWRLKVIRRRSLVPCTSAFVPRYRDFGFPAVRRRSGSRPGCLPAKEECRGNRAVRSNQRLCTAAHVDRPSDTSGASRRKANPGRKSAWHRSRARFFRYEPHSRRFPFPEVHTALEFARPRPIDLAGTIRHEECRGSVPPPMPLDQHLFAHPK